MADKTDLLEMATRIVAAYAGKNALSPDELQSLIEQTWVTLSGLSGNGGRARQLGLEPPVPIGESITDEFIICLEDGKQFKSLKRHLRTQYDMSPEEYRAKWGLPRDYPMVAPNYARERSKLARDMQLGKNRDPD